jgi:hypothetical protein
MTGQFTSLAVGDPTPTTVFVARQGEMTFTYLALFNNGQTSYEFQSLRATFAEPTPEPATLVPFGLGGGGLWLLRRRRDRC